MGGDKRYPFPAFPNGWYCVDFSENLKPGDIQSRKLFGRDLILFRTPGGTPALVDAYCPHMGAHMAKGGCLKGETLECPMHGFRFDVHGTCTETAYKTKVPPKAKIESWPIREMHGVVLTYYDCDGKPPAWEVPDIPTERWSPMRHICWPLRSHPQETSENSVDLGHLAVVHGYESPMATGELHVDGPHLSATYSFKRRPGPFRVFVDSLPVEFHAAVHGLGYSLVHAKVPKLGMHTRHFVFATPTDGTMIELRIALSMERHPNPGQISPAFKVMPWPLVERLLTYMGFREYAADVQQDFKIWENKVYIDPPVLALGDGPIARYRKWCLQFYPGYHPKHWETVAAAGEAA